MDQHGFHPFDPTTPHIAYAVLGGFVVIFGMFSLLIKEKMYLGEAPIATVFGIIIGPYVLGVFDPRSWGSGDSRTSNTITLEVTRVVLAIGLFAIGVELPGRYVLRHWRSLALLLIPMMTYGWLVSGALIYALVPGLSFLSSLVVAACLTPTDPILAAAVVGGKYANKHVPEHLRHILAAESAANDGLAFPFLFLGLYLTVDRTPGEAIGKWFYMSWLYEVTFGTIFGALLGYSFRELMKFCERKNLIDRHSYVAQYVSLAMLTIGATTMLGSDDLLAAFSCGTAFTWDLWFNKQTEESQFSNVIDLLFNCACFIYIGAWIPFDTFSQLDLTLAPWRLIVIAILILLLRRLPAIIVLYRWIPDVKTLREALFTGHFGPMGVGAVFISALAQANLPVAESPPQGQTQFLAATIQPIVSFVVLCSIVTHGLSIPFFSLGRRVRSVRTASRRASMDPGLPEWTTQIRRFPSGSENVMINRKERSRPFPINPDTQAPEPTLESPGSDDSSGDGAREWREGRDLVVEVVSPHANEERRVKVFKDVFHDDEGPMKQEVREMIQEDIDAFKKLMKHEAKVLSQGVEKGALRSAGSSSGTAALNAPPTRGEDVTEGDEGEWRDEPTDETGEVSGPSAPTVTIEEPAKPVRPKKDGRPKVYHFAHGRSGRRRDSVRRALLGVVRRPHLPAQSASTETHADEALPSTVPSTAPSSAASVIDVPTEDASRGRVGPEPGSPIPLSRRSSLRPATRTSSPSASRIRFADETDRGPPTPIVRSSSGLIHSSTPGTPGGVYAGHPISNLPSPAGEPNRVMFDVPEA